MTDLVAARTTAKLAVGTLTSGGGRTLTWDAAQRPTSITSGGVTETYAYDADGARAQRTVGGVTTAYVGDDYEVNAPGGAWRVTYRVGGQVVAQRTSAGVVTYLHGDHLGSVSAATSSGGAVVNVQTYTPWGEVRTGDLPQTTRDFTGQRRDGTGLLHYNARYYDPGLGLFLSADTIVPGTASGAGGAADTVGPDAQAGLAALTVGFQEPALNSRLAEEHRALLAAGFFGRETPSSVGPGNPQALNRYAYVLNNPVRYTDPTGHGSCDYVGCGGEVVNTTNQPIKVVGSVIVTKATCERLGQPRCESGNLGDAIVNVEVVLQPGQSSLDHNMADVDGIVTHEDSDDYYVVRVGNHERIILGATADGRLSHYSMAKVRLPGGIIIILNDIPIAEDVARGLAAWWQGRTAEGPRRGKSAHISECVIYGTCQSNSS